MSSPSFLQQLTSLLASCALLIAAAPGMVLSAATKLQIVPLQTTATFSTQSAKTKWSVPIKSTDGRTVYVLSFDSFLWVSGQVEGVDLILKRPHDRADAPNLLEPPGRWHGLQDYMFAADDLAKGAQNSAFGEQRTITDKRRGLVVRILVSNAKVSPIPSGDFQLDSLNLKIEVDNLGS
jgi:hypothetical protein